MSVELMLYPFALAFLEKKESRRGLVPDIPSSYFIQTVCRDEELLRQSLIDLDYIPSSLEAPLVIGIGSVYLRFSYHESGVYCAEVPHFCTEEDALDLLEKVEDEYRRLLQERVYKRLRDQAKLAGLILEQEEVTDDNDVVLTFQISD